MNFDLVLDVVPKLVAAFLDSLMFFSKGPLGASEARGLQKPGKTVKVSKDFEDFGTVLKY